MTDSPTPTDGMRDKLAQQSRSVATNGNGQPTIAQLIDRQRSEIARALPRHMDADRLARIATTTIKTTPALLECTASSLLGALMLSAQTGMEPGPLGHAYLIPRRIKGVMECQWMLGYRGIIELARRSGKIVSIEAREVCERDRFEFAYGLEERLLHEPYMAGERGPIVAFWGLAKFTDGGHYFVVMSKADVDKAKERSDAGRKNFGPWVSDYAAMGRKTVIRRMAPFLPLSAEQAGAIAQDETVHNRVAPDMVTEPPESGWMEADSWETSAEPVEMSPVRETFEDAAPVADRPDPTDTAWKSALARVGRDRSRAFPCEGAPKGTKTNQQRRLAHALAYGITGRVVASFNELSLAELLEVSKFQEDIAIGAAGWELEDGGVSFVDASGALFTVRWTDLAEADRPAEVAS